MSYDELRKIAALAAIGTPGEETAQFDKDLSKAIKTINSINYPNTPAKRFVKEMLSDLQKIRNHHTLNCFQEGFPSGQKE